MNDDTRINALEQITAVLTARAADQAELIRTFGPLVVDNVRNQERIAALEKQVDEDRRDLDEFEKAMAKRVERDAERDKEAKRFKVTTFISLGGLLLALGGSMLTLLQAGGHP